MFFLGRSGQWAVGSGQWAVGRKSSIPQVVATGQIVVFAIGCREVVSSNVSRRDAEPQSIFSLSFLRVSASLREAFSFSFLQMAKLPRHFPFHWHFG